MQVLKFGGTSVNDAKAIAQVAAIVADQLKTDPNVVVVTSAMRGVTDLLIDSAKAAAAGDRQTYRDARLTLIARHHDAAEALVARPGRPEPASRATSTSASASSSACAWPSPSWAS